MTALLEYVVTVLLEYLGMLFVNYYVKSGDVSPDCKAIAESVVGKYIYPSSAGSGSVTNVGNSVYAYATDFLTMALLWHGLYLL